MNHIILKIKIALSAFVFGLFATWFLMQFSQFKIFDASISDITLNWRIQKSFLIYSLPNTKFDDGLKISFVNVTDKNEKVKAINLRVENMTREAVYFSGYSLTNVCSYIVKSETAEHMEVCECGFGLERQILLTGESTVLTAYSPIKDEKMKVGFYFTLKNDEPSRVFWSDEF